MMWRETVNALLALRELLVKNVRIFDFLKFYILATCGASKCNGAGDCVTIGDLYKQYTATINSVKTYTNWEFNHTTSCVCKNGIIVVTVNTHIIVK